MNKPWHDKPLLSVEESEAMLHAEEGREISPKASKVISALLGIFTCLAVFAYGILDWIFN